MQLLLIELKCHTKIWFPPSLPSRHLCPRVSRLWPQFLFATQIQPLCCPIGLTRPRCCYTGADLAYILMTTPQHSATSQSPHYASASITKIPPMLHTNPIDRGQGDPLPSQHPPHWIQAESICQWCMRRDLEVPRVSRSGWSLCCLDVSIL